MRVQQRADDALAGLEAWERTSLADLRAELARAQGQTVKTADGFRDGALKDFKEVLGELRREDRPEGKPGEGPDPARDKAKAADAAQPAPQKAPEPAKPAQAPQPAAAKVPAKAST